MENFVVLLVLTLIFASTGEDFDPKRTKLVDYAQFSPEWNNLFFRGNMPARNGVFVFKELVDVMRNITQVAGIKFPDNFTLIDVSYLNPFEYKDEEIEKKFFESNPHLGIYYNKIIAGTILKPPENDTQVIKEIVKLYIEDLSFDRLAEKMNFFRKLLLTKEKQPVVIYGHCEAGTDRTGEVSGAYYMEFLRVNFTQALYIDNHIQNRDMFEVSRNMMQWYCFYLKFIRDYSWLECLL